MSTLSCTSGFVKWIVRSVKLPINPILWETLSSPDGYAASSSSPDVRHDDGLRLDSQFQKILYPPIWDVHVQVDDVTFTLHIDDCAVTGELRPAQFRIDWLEIRIPAGSVYDRVEFCMKRYLVVCRVQ